MNCLFSPNDLEEIEECSAKEDLSKPLPQLLEDILMKLDKKVCSSERFVVIFQSHTVRLDYI
jgi:hypothetical protein